jgi:hypothetical protein
MLSSLMISTEIPLISVTINLKKQLVGREYAILDTFITKLVTQRGGYPGQGQTALPPHLPCRDPSLSKLHHFTRNPRNTIARQHNARRR